MQGKAESFLDLQKSECLMFPFKVLPLKVLAKYKIIKTKMSSFFIFGDYVLLKRNSYLICTSPCLYQLEEHCILPHLRGELTSVECCSEINLQFLALHTASCCHMQPPV